MSKQWHWSTGQYFSIPLCKLRGEHMPWSRALPHCCLMLVFSASVRTQASLRDLSTFLGPSVSVGAGIHSHSRTGAMQDMFFEFSDSRFPEADGYLIVVNHGNMPTKPFINSCLLLGPGMLVIPSNLPALLWHLIAVCFGHSVFSFFQGVENTFSLAECKDK